MANTGKSNQKKSKKTVTKKRDSKKQVVPFDTHSMTSREGEKKFFKIEECDEIKGYLEEHNFEAVKSFLRRHWPKSNVDSSKKLSVSIIDLITPHLNQNASLLVPLLWTQSCTISMINSIMDLKVVAAANEGRLNASMRKAIKIVLESPEKSSPTLIKLLEGLTSKSEVAK